MRRGAAFATLAAVALGACSPAGPKAGDRRPTGPAVPPIGEAPPPAATPVGALPLVGLPVRVGVAVDVDAVEVGATAPWELVDRAGRLLVDGAPGETVKLYASGGGVYAQGPAGTLGPLEDLARIRVRGGADGMVVVDGAKYRGVFLPRASASGKLTLVNLLDLEEYLIGVVPREIPAREFEAVKAQAVAARTYAVGNMGNRSALGFDFYATVNDQVYGGVDSENADATRAVRETSGEILTYDGRPILAFYHSTCGGHTAAIDEVWDRAPLPYLKSESDEKPGGGYYCDISNRFRWTQKWSGAELRATLARYLPGSPSVRRIEEVSVTGRTTSGRAQALRVVADGRSWEIPGDSIRRVLRTPDGALLNSSLLLRLQPDRSGGNVDGLTVEGGGWGHGIGMCQMGAIGRAAAGQDYREILGAYYRGATITRID